MKYNKLKSLLSEREISITEFCEKLQFTRQGLQKSLDNDMMAYNKVLQSCLILNISPNEFFEWETNEKPFIAAECRPYSQAPAVSKRETPDWKDEVILGQQRTIARLEAELDRQAGKKHKSA